MGNYKSDFLNAITERGFLHQCTDTDALDDRASSEVVSAYIGFDCTAPSLHVGSLLPVMLLRWLQRTGHKPIVLMGGGTTKVGDPSGKDESRLLLTEEKINENIVAVKFSADTLKSLIRNRLNILYKLTAHNVGIEIKKEIFVESILLKFKNLPAVIVTPDLLTPGINDIA